MIDDVKAFLCVLGFMAGCLCIAIAVLTSSGACSASDAKVDTSGNDNATQQSTQSGIINLSWAPIAAGLGAGGGIGAILAFMAWNKRVDFDGDKLNIGALRDICIQQLQAGRELMKGLYYRK